MQIRFIFLYQEMLCCIDAEMTNANYRDHDKIDLQGITQT